MYRDKFLRFYRLIESFDDLNYLMAMLNFLISPTISNLKVATMVNLSNSKRNLKDTWSEHKEYLIDNLKVDYVELRENKKGILIYFYKKNLLKEKLSYKDIESYLLSLDYKKNENIEYYLNNLKLNFKKSVNCPNEVGIFLGYPLKDVIDFNCKDKECKLSGYWKCYNDAYTSKIIFEQYDKAKLKIVRKYYKDAV